MAALDFYNKNYFYGMTRNASGDHYFEAHPNLMIYCKNKNYFTSLKIGENYPNLLEFFNIIMCLSIHNCKNNN